MPMDVNVWSLGEWIAGQGFEKKIDWTHAKMRSRLCFVHGVRVSYVSVLRIKELPTRRRGTSGGSNCHISGFESIYWERNLMRTLMTILK